jgi:hypothetical protein
VKEEERGAGSTSLSIPRCPLGTGEDGTSGTSAVPSGQLSPLPALFGRGERGGGTSRTGRESGGGVARHTKR